MSPVHVITASVMTILAGLLLLARAVRPAPPRLASVLEQLTPGTGTRAGRERGGEPVGGPGDAPGGRSGALSGTQARTRPARWIAALPPSLAHAAQHHLGATEQDLAILGLDRAVLAARKLTYGLAGLAVVPLLNLVLTLAGAGFGWAIPAVVSLGVGLLAWRVPSRQVAVRAQAAREQFRAALTVFLGLVGLERQVRGSPTEALEEAARISGGWPFVMIHTAIYRAELAGVMPWRALDDLGARIDIPQLRNLADIVASAADGAAVFDTLLAEARNMRNAQLSTEEADAGVINERLTLPQVLMAVGFIALLGWPAFSRI